MSGSWPAMPGKDGGASDALMASAKASAAAGLVAVSRAAATSSAGAPARPLLKCSVTRHWRDAANSASTSRAWLAGSISGPGIHTDS